MNVESRNASIFLISVLLVSFMLPLSMAGSYQSAESFSAQPTLLTHQYTILGQKLYVSIPPSLYNYYSSQNHILYGDGDYANLVTPQAVASIAACLRNVTLNLPNSDEQFADAALSLVHQIPYVLCSPKFPVESLVGDSGDCVCLSLLAASIMEAGGLDVVLIHYIGISPGHMNVGVYLPSTPAYHNFLTTPVGFSYDNKTYWAAESTAATDWKVGDQSGDLNGATAVVIPLDNSEQSSPSQVSSSFSVPLLSSLVTLYPYQAPIIDQNTSISALLISGSISPAYSGETVTIYVSNNEKLIDYFKTVTNDYGNYLYIWNFTSPGTYYITASWSGNLNYTCADSETNAVFIGPESFVEFNTPLSTYIFREGSTPIFTADQLQPLQGVNNFLNTSLGSNFTFSYDFMILKARNPVSTIQTTTYTIPALNRTLTLGIGKNPKRLLVQMHNVTMTLPVNVPAGMGSLVIPDDFNYTINNQFCFILQKDSENNYSLNAKALNAYESANLSLYNARAKSKTAFLNAAPSLEENTWYTITQSLSKNGLTTNLQDSSGSLVEHSITPIAAMNQNGMIILITNNVDNAVVFKNLTNQTTDSISQSLVQPSVQPIVQPSTNNNKPTVNNESLPPYVYLSVLSVAISAPAASALYVRKKTKKPANTVLVQSQYSCSSEQSLIQLPALHVNTKKEAEKPSSNVLVQSQYSCSSEQSLMQARARAKILRLLSMERGMNITTIVSKTNSSYNETFRNLKILEREGVVIITNLARVTRVELNWEKPKTKELLQALKTLETEDSTQ